ncbi:titin-like [Ctenocephalides felis]|uniref:titin-like n=1 Tax=Ctenocephalides felis TaxID=7515 RepID=UPI000E6E3F51|nr:titin-like [Ctenocephalides felis]
MRRHIDNNKGPVEPPAPKITRSDVFPTSKEFALKLCLRSISRSTEQKDLYEAHRFLMEYLRRPDYADLINNYIELTDLSEKDLRKRLRQSIVCFYFYNDSLEQAIDIPVTNMYFISQIVVFIDMKALEWQTFKSRKNRANEEMRKFTNRSASTVLSLLKLIFNEDIFQILPIFLRCRCLTYEFKEFFDTIFRKLLEQRKFKVTTQKNFICLVLIYKLWKTLFLYGSEEYTFVQKLSLTNILIHPNLMENSDDVIVKVFKVEKTDVELKELTLFYMRQPIDLVAACLDYFKFACAESDFDEYLQHTNAPFIQIDEATSEASSWPDKQPKIEPGTDDATKNKNKSRKNKLSSFGRDSSCDENSDDDDVILLSDDEKKYDPQSVSSKLYNVNNSSNWRNSVFLNIPNRGESHRNVDRNKSCVDNSDDDDVILLSDENNDADRKFDSKRPLSNIDYLKNASTLRKFLEASVRNESKRIINNSEYDTICLTDSDDDSTKPSRPLIRPVAISKLQRKPEIVTSTPIRNGLVSNRARKNTIRKQFEPLPRLPDSYLEGIAVLTEKKPKVQNDVSDVRSKLPIFPKLSCIANIEDNLAQRVYNTNRRKVQVNDKDSLAKISNRNKEANKNDFFGKLYNRFKETSSVDVSSSKLLSTSSLDTRTDLSKPSQSDEKAVVFSTVIRNDVTHDFKNSCLDERIENVSSSTSTIMESSNMLPELKKLEDPINQKNTDPCARLKYDIGCDKCSKQLSEPNTDHLTPIINKDASVSRRDFSVQLRETETNDNQFCTAFDKSILPQEISEVEVASPLLKTGCDKSLEYVLTLEKSSTGDVLCTNFTKSGDKIGESNEIEESVSKRGVEDSSTSAPTKTSAKSEINISTDLEVLPGDSSINEPSSQYPEISNNDSIISTDDLCINEQKNEQFNKNLRTSQIDSESLQIKLSDETSQVEKNIEKVLESSQNCSKNKNVSTSKEDTLEDKISEPIVNIEVIDHLSQETSNDDKDQDKLLESSQNQDILEDEIPKSIVDIEVTDHILQENLSQETLSSCDDKVTEKKFLQSSQNSTESTNLLKDSSNQDEISKPIVEIEVPDILSQETSCGDEDKEKSLESSQICNKQISTLLKNSSNQDILDDEFPELIVEIEVTDHILQGTSCDDNVEEKFLQSSQNFTESTNLLEDSSKKDKLNDEISKPIVEFEVTDHLSQETSCDDKDKEKLLEFSENCDNQISTALIKDSSNQDILEDEIPELIVEIEVTDHILQENSSQGTSCDDKDKEKLLQSSENCDNQILTAIIKDSSNQDQLEDTIPEAIEITHHLSQENLSEKISPDTDKEKLSESSESCNNQISMPLIQDSSNQNKLEDKIPEPIVDIEIPHYLSQENLSEEISCDDKDKEKLSESSESCNNQISTALIKDSSNQDKLEDKIPESIVDIEITHNLSQETSCDDKHKEKPLEFSENCDNRILTALIKDSSNQDKVEDKIPEAIVDIEITHHLSQENLLQETSCDDKMHEDKEKPLEFAENCDNQISTTLIEDSSNQDQLEDKITEAIVDIEITHHLSQENLLQETSCDDKLHKDKEKPLEFSENCENQISTTLIEDSSDQDKLNDEISKAIVDIEVTDNLSQEILCDDKNKENLLESSQVKDEISEPIVDIEVTSIAAISTKTVPEEVNKTDCNDYLLKVENDKSVLIDPKDKDCSKSHTESTVEQETTEIIPKVKLENLVPDIVPDHVSDTKVDKITDETLVETIKESNIEQKNVEKECLEESSSDGISKIIEACSKIEEEKGETFTDSTSNTVPQISHDIDSSKQDIADVIDNSKLIEDKSSLEAENLSPIDESAILVSYELESENNNEVKEAEKQSTPPVDQELNKQDDQTTSNSIDTGEINDNENTSENFDLVSGKMNALIACPPALDNEKSSEISDGSLINQERENIPERDGKNSVDSKSLQQVETVKMAQEQCENKSIFDSSLNESQEKPFKGNSDPSKKEENSLKIEAVDAKSAVLSIPQVKNKTKPIRKAPKQRRRKQKGCFKGKRRKQIRNKNLAGAAKNVDSTTDNICADNDISNNRANVEIIAENSNKPVIDAISPNSEPKKNLLQDIQKENISTEDNITNIADIALASCEKDQNIIDEVSLKSELIESNKNNEIEVKTETDNEHCNTQESSTDHPFIFNLDIIVAQQVEVSSQSSSDEKQVQSFQEDPSCGNDSLNLEKDESTIVEKIEEDKSQQHVQEKLPDPEPYVDENVEKSTNKLVNDMEFNKVMDFVKLKTENLDRKVIKNIAIDTVNKNQTNIFKNATNLMIKSVEKVMKNIKKKSRKTGTLKKFETSESLNDNPLFIEDTDTLIGAEEVCITQDPKREQLPEISSLDNLPKAENEHQNYNDIESPVEIARKTLLEKIKIVQESCKKESKIVRENSNSNQKDFETPFNKPVKKVTKKNKKISLDVTNSESKLKETTNMRVTRNSRLRDTKKLEDCTENLPSVVELDAAANIESPKNDVHQIDALSLAAIRKSRRSADEISKIDLDSNNIKHEIPAVIRKTRKSADEIKMDSPVSTRKNVRTRKSFDVINTDSSISESDRMIQTRSNKTVISPLNKAISFGRVNSGDSTELLSPKMETPKRSKKKEANVKAQISPNEFDIDDYPLSELKSIIRKNDAGSKSFSYVEQPKEDIPKSPLSSETKLELFKYVQLTPKSDIISCDDYDPLRFFSQVASNVDECRRMVEKGNNSTKEHIKSPVPIDNNTELNKKSNDYLTTPVKKRGVTNSRVNKKEKQVKKPSSEEATKQLLAHATELCSKTRKTIQNTPAQNVLNNSNLNMHIQNETPDIKIETSVANVDKRTIVEHSKKGKRNRSKAISPSRADKTLSTVSNIESTSSEIIAEKSSESKDALNEDNIIMQRNRNKNTPSLTPTVINKCLNEDITAIQEKVPDLKSDTTSTIEQVAIRIIELEKQIEQSKKAKRSRGRNASNNLLNNVEAVQINNKALDVIGSNTTIDTVQKVADVPVESKSQFVEEPQKKHNEFTLPEPKNIVTKQPVAAKDLLSPTENKPASASKKTMILRRYSSEFAKESISTSPTVSSVSNKQIIKQNTPICKPDLDDIPGGSIPQENAEIKLRSILKKQTDNVELPKKFVRKRSLVTFYCDSLESSKGEVNLSEDNKQNLVSNKEPGMFGVNTPNEVQTISQVEKTSVEEKEDTYPDNKSPDIIDLSVTHTEKCSDTDNYNATISPSTSVMKMNEPQIKKNRRKSSTIFHNKRSANSENTTENNRILCESYQPIWENELLLSPSLRSQKTNHYSDAKIDTSSKYDLRDIVDLTVRGEKVDDPIDYSANTLRSCNNDKVIAKPSEVRKNISDFSINAIIAKKEPEKKESMVKDSTMAINALGKTSATKASLKSYTDFVNKPETLHSTCKPIEIRAANIKPGSMSNFVKDPQISNIYSKEVLQPTSNIEIARKVIFSPQQIVGKSKSIKGGLKTNKDLSKIIEKIPENVVGISIKQADELNKHEIKSISYLNKQNQQAVEKLETTNEDKTLLFNQTSVLSDKIDTLKDDQKCNKSDAGATMFIHESGLNIQICNSLPPSDIKINEKSETRRIIQNIEEKIKRIEVDCKESHSKLLAREERRKINEKEEPCKKVKHDAKEKTKYSKVSLDVQDHSRNTLTEQHFIDKVLSIDLRSNRKENIDNVVKNITTKTNESLRNYVLHDEGACGKFNDIINESMLEEIKYMIANKDDNIIKEKPKMTNENVKTGSNIEDKQIIKSENTREIEYKESEKNMRNKPSQLLSKTKNAEENKLINKTIIKDEYSKQESKQVEANKVSVKKQNLNSEFNQLIKSDKLEVIGHQLNEQVSKEMSKFTVVKKNEEKQIQLSKEKFKTAEVKSEEKEPQISKEAFKYAELEKSEEKEPQISKETFKVAEVKEKEPQMCTEMLKSAEVKKEKEAQMCTEMLKSADVMKSEEKAPQISKETLKSAEVEKSEEKEAQMCTKMLKSADVKKREETEAPLCTEMLKSADIMKSEEKAPQISKETSKSAEVKKREKKEAQMCTEMLKSADVMKSEEKAPQISKETSKYAEVMKSEEKEPQISKEMPKSAEVEKNEKKETSKSAEDKKCEKIKLQISKETSEPAEVKKSEKKEPQISREIFKSAEVKKNEKKETSKSAEVKKSEKIEPQISKETPKSAEVKKSEEEVPQNSKETSKSAEVKQSEKIEAQISKETSNSAELKKSEDNEPDISREKCKSAEVEKNEKKEASKSAEVKKSEEKESQISKDTSKITQKSEETEQQICNVTSKSAVVTKDEEKEVHISKEKPKSMVTKKSEEKERINKEKSKSAAAKKSKEKDNVTNDVKVYGKKNKASADLPPKTEAVQLPKEIASMKSIHEVENVKKFSIEKDVQANFSSPVEDHITKQDKSKVDDEKLVKVFKQSEHVSSDNAVKNTEESINNQMMIQTKPADENITKDTEIMRDEPKTTNTTKIICNKLSKNNKRANEEDNVQDAVKKIKLSKENVKSKKIATCKKSQGSTNSIKNRNEQKVSITETSVKAMVKEMELPEQQNVGETVDENNKILVENKSKVKEAITVDVSIQEKSVETLKESVKEENVAPVMSFGKIDEIIKNKSSKDIANRDIPGESIDPIEGKSFDVPNEQIKDFVKEDNKAVKNNEIIIEGLTQVPVSQPEEAAKEKSNVDLLKQESKMIMLDIAKRDETEKNISKTMQPVEVSMKNRTDTSVKQMEQETPKAILDKNLQEESKSSNEGRIINKHKTHRNKEIPFATTSEGSTKTPIERKVEKVDKAKINKISVKEENMSVPDKISKKNISKAIKSNRPSVENTTEVGNPKLEKDYSGKHDKDVQDKESPKSTQDDIKSHETKSIVECTSNVKAKELENITKASTEQKLKKESKENFDKVSVKEDSNQFKNVNVELILQGKEDSEKMVKAGATDINKLSKQEQKNSKETRNRILKVDKNDDRSRLENVKGIEADGKITSKKCDSKEKELKSRNEEQIKEDVTKKDRKNKKNSNDKSPKHNKDTKSAADLALNEVTTSTVHLCKEIKINENKLKDVENITKIKEENLTAQENISSNIKQKQVERSESNAEKKHQNKVIENKSSSDVKSITRNDILGNKDAEKSASLSDPAKNLKNHIAAAFERIQRNDKKLLSDKKIDKNEHKRNRSSSSNDEKNKYHTTNAIKDLKDSPYRVHIVHRSKSDRSSRKDESSKAKDKSVDRKNSSSQSRNSKYDKSLQLTKNLEYADINKNDVLTKVSTEIPTSPVDALGTGISKSDETTQIDSMAVDHTNLKKMTPTTRRRSRASGDSRSSSTDTCYSEKISKEVRKDELLKQVSEKLSKKEDKTDESSRKSCDDLVKSIDMQTKPDSKPEVDVRLKSDKSRVKQSSSTKNVKSGESINKPDESSIKSDSKLAVDAKHKSDKTRTKQASTIDKDKCDKNALDVSFKMSNHIPRSSDKSYSTEVKKTDKNIISKNSGDNQTKRASEKNSDSKKDLKESVSSKTSRDTKSKSNADKNKTNSNRQSANENLMHVESKVVITEIRKTESSDQSNKRSTEQPKSSIEIRTSEKTSVRSRSSRNSTESRNKRTLEENIVSNEIMCKKPKLDNSNVGTSNKCKIKIIKGSKSHEAFINTGEYSTNKTQLNEEANKITSSIDEANNKVIEKIIGHAKHQTISEDKTTAPGPVSFVQNLDEQPKHVQKSELSIPQVNEITNCFSAELSNNNQTATSVVESANHVMNKDALDEAKIIEDCLNLLTQESDKGNAGLELEKLVDENTSVDFSNTIVQDKLTLDDSDCMQKVPSGDNSADKSILDNETLFPKELVHEVMSALKNISNISESDKDILEGIQNSPSINQMPVIQKVNKKRKSTDCDADIVSTQGKKVKLNVMPDDKGKTLTARIGKSGSTLKLVPVEPIPNYPSIAEPAKEVKDQECKIQSQLATVVDAIIQQSNKIPGLERRRDSNKTTIENIEETYSVKKSKKKRKRERKSDDKFDVMEDNAEHNVVENVLQHSNFTDSSTNTTSFKQFGFLLKSTTSQKP